MRPHLLDLQVFSGTCRSPPIAETVTEASKLRVELQRDDAWQQCASWDELVRRLLTSEQLRAVQLDQLTVNRYPAGVGLSPHVDAHSAFTGAVLSLSLGSSAVMEFRRGDARKCLFLPPRSLVVMTGECRYAWYGHRTPLQPPPCQTFFYAMQPYTGGRPSEPMHLPRCDT